MSAAVKSVAYDLVVIGGGSGGLQAAWDAATLHKAKVAVVDVQTLHGPPYYSALGGTCVNVGCVPKKLFVTGAKFHEDFKDAKGFGWSIEANEVKHSWPKLIEAKNRAIKNINESYEGMFRDTEGLDFYLGWASFEDKNTVVVRSEKDVNSPVTTRLTAPHTLIASGGWPFVPKFPGSELCITSNEAFYLPECPKRVLIVGGGFIAVEFASIFQSYKVPEGEVHLAYRGDLFLRGFDISCREEIRDQIRARGVNLHFNENPAKIELQTNGEKLVTFESGKTMLVDVVMYATGRVPNTGNLNLDKVGVKLSKSGAVVVNNLSQTSTENIYAIGDVTERITLTPVAINEGSAFVSTVFGKSPKPPNHKNVASAVFSIPQIGTCGLTEDEAAKQYEVVRIYQTRDTPLMHQLTGNEHKKYLLKVVVNDADNAVLGIHIVAPDAAEMIQFVGILLKIGVKITDFWETIGVHPTTAEDILSLRDPKYFFVKGAKVDSLPAPATTSNL